MQSSIQCHVAIHHCVLLSLPVPQGQSQVMIECDQETKQLPVMCVTEEAKATKEIEKTDGDDHSY